MNRISTIVFLTAAGAAISAGLTSRVRAFARQRLLDVPNERSSHVSPTPRGGGLAIVVVVVGGLLVAGVPLGTWRFPGGYLAGALLVAVVSFVDDVRSVPFPVRLLVHATAALIAIAAYTNWRGAAFPLVTGVSGAALALTFLWIVGLTNAYNFMDGIDGLAGTQAVIAGVTWGGIGLLVSSPAAAVTGALVAAASAGFLVHNWPPARIFMGDVGSAFLGYTFAVLPLMTDPIQPSIILAGLLTLGLFVFDTAFTFLRRLAARENVFRAHRSHLYQRLVGGGSTHRAVTLFYATLAAALGGAAVLAVLFPQHALPVSFLAAITAGGTLWLNVQRQERRSRRRNLQHALQPQ